MSGLPGIAFEESFTHSFEANALYSRNRRSAQLVADIIVFTGGFWDAEYDPIFQQYILDFAGVPGDGLEIARESYLNDLAYYNNLSRSLREDLGVEVIRGITFQYPGRWQYGNTEVPRWTSAGSHYGPPQAGMPIARGVEYMQSGAFNACDSPGTFLDALNEFIPTAPDPEARLVYPIISTGSGQPFAAWPFYTARGGGQIDPPMFMPWWGTFANPQSCTPLEEVEAHLTARATQYGIGPEDVLRHIEVRSWGPPTNSQPFDSSRVYGAHLRALAGGLEHAYSHLSVWHR